MRTLSKPAKKVAVGAFAVTGAESDFTQRKTRKGGKAVRCQSRYARIAELNLSPAGVRGCGGFAVTVAGSNDRMVERVPQGKHK